jgi:hypothetical protein
LVLLPLRNFFAADRNLLVVEWRLPNLPQIFASKAKDGLGTLFSLACYRPRA